MNEYHHRLMALVSEHIRPSCRPDRPLRWATCDWTEEIEDDDGNDTTLTCDQRPIAYFSYFQGTNVHLIPYCDQHIHDSITFNAPTLGDCRSSYHMHLDWMTPPVALLWR